MITPASVAMDFVAAVARAASRCSVCGEHKSRGYWFCRRCTASLPGGVQYDLREERAGAFARALEILGVTK